MDYTSFYWSYMLLLKPPVLMHSCSAVVLFPDCELGFIQRGGTLEFPSPTEILKLSMVIIVVPSILAF